MTEADRGAMDYDAFIKMLSDVLLVAEDKLKPDASFATELLVDSIRWVEMALRIEQMGVAIPTEAFWDIHTVGQAYDYYLAHYANET